MPKTRQDVEKEIENASKEGRTINLRGWNLERVDLSGLNLAGADCRGADLNHALLRFANLEGAKFGVLPSWMPSMQRGVLAGSSFLLACKVIGFNWNDSILVGLSVGALASASKGTYRTDLRVTDFTRASLKGVDLTEAKNDRRYFVAHRSKQCQSN